MKRWSLYMQLPTGEWTRVSNNAYHKDQAEKVWKETLLDQLRTGGPARELRPVEERVNEADTDKAVHGESGLQQGGKPHWKARDGGGQDKNNMLVGWAEGTRKVWLVQDVRRATLGGEGPRSIQRKDGHSEVREVPPPSQGHLEE